jgi:carboxypeptidase family protein
MPRSAVTDARRIVVRAIPLLFSLAIAAGCSDSTGVTSPRPTMLGIVRNAATNAPVAGAQVIMGNSVDTTDQTGRYVFIHLEPGPTKLKVNATGFDSLTMDVTVTTGEVLQNVGLKRKKLFDVDSFSAYIPDSLEYASAILVALGGPDTRGFSAGTPFGAPLPEVEASLQTFGSQLREMARVQHFAVIGTSTASMPDGAASDTIILNALAAIAAKSGRPEIANSPILMYGLSGGGPEASGFAARNADRIAGVFLKSPSSVELLTTDKALAIPTFVVLAELDAFVDNTAIKAAFQANRKSGAFWGLAMEAGVPHHFLTPAQQELTSTWMSATLKARVAPFSDGQGLVEFGPGGLTAYPESLGWLGNHVTGEVASWEDYTGDRGSASWFPSQAVADNWRTFRKPGE